FCALPVLTRAEAKHWSGHWKVWFKMVMNSLLLEESSWMSLVGNQNEWLSRSNRVPHSPWLEKDHNIVREEARELMRQIEEKSIEYDPDRQVTAFLFANSLTRLLKSFLLQLSIILEYIPGRITGTLDRLIALYRPDSVVVGRRGRRTWQTIGIGMGSV